MANGIDWENKYGTAFAAMDVDTKLTTIYAAIGDLYTVSKSISKQNECLETQQKCLDKHQTYFKILWIVLTLIVIPVILMSVQFAIR